MWVQLNAFFAVLLKKQTCYVRYHSYGDDRIKNFKIDPPLDPANKYLIHPCVESAEAVNLYQGNVVLDPNGEAWVTLPEWLETLNKDFRYPLTAIGAPAPNLHVAEEIQNNRFRIAGGNAGLKVSWQISGVRNDAWAKAHAMEAETVKPDSERGYYLHPELHGQSAKKGIERAHKGPPVQRPEPPQQDNRLGATRHTASLTTEFKELLCKKQ